MTKQKGKQRSVGIHAFGAILERIEEQNRATYEVVVGLRRELKDEMKELEQRLTLRIGALEFAVKTLFSSFQSLTGETRENSVGIKQLSEDVRALAETLRAKPDLTELRALERRMNQVEERLREHGLLSG